MGLDSPLLVAPGKIDSMKVFLELNPTVPSGRMYIDDSTSYEGFTNLGFGMLGTSLNIVSARIRIPSLGWEAMKGYAKNFLWLTPVTSLPSGVLVLGGTIVVHDGAIIYMSKDRAPGDYPQPNEVLDKVQEALGN